MTSKRLKKLWMSQGVSRDTAEFAIKRIKLMDRDGHCASNAEKYEKITTGVKRTTNHA